MNGFTVMNYDENNMDPNRFVEVSHISVSGRVIDKDTGNSLEGVRIAIDGTNHSTATNQDGWFIIEQVETGAQNIQVSKSEYKNIKKEVLLTSDSLQVIHFELEKGDGDLIEGSEQVSDEKSKGELKPFGGGLYILFAFFTIPAIMLIYFRKNFWMASLFIILSMLSFGYIFGTVTAGVALVLLFTMKNDFDTRSWTTVLASRRRYQPTRRAPSQPVHRGARIPQTRSSEFQLARDRFNKRESLPPPPPPPQIPPQLEDSDLPPIKKF
jgi:hypothetical protein